MSLADAAGLAADSRTLDALRAKARSEPDKALKDAAKQFEALFLQMVLKSMRDATPQGGDMLASDAGRTYIGMLDAQLAQSMAGNGLGLAEMMLRQLSQAGKSQVLKEAASSGPKPAGAAAASMPAVAPGDPRQAFVDRMLPHALEAGRESGVRPRFILAQAALESGWGKGEIRGPDGTPSYNLFGIKAGGSWTGKTVSVPTTEYVDGKAVRITAKFRAYESYAEGFRDWATLVSKNPRYVAAVRDGHNAEGFARGLARGGYATDPAYAEKLTRVINSALLAQRRLA